jgi:hypothetical protein
VISIISQSLGSTVKRSYSICLKTFADKLTSLRFFPNFIPTVFNFEDNIVVGKEMKEEDLEHIPLPSRFKVALRCIAFVIVSSSVATEPSSASTCLVLRLVGGACAATGGGGEGKSVLAGDIGGV